MPPQKPRNQAQMWRDPAIAGLELFQAAFATHTFPQHAHASYSLGLNDGGLGLIRCRGQRWLAAPHQLMFFHPGEIHGGWPQSGCWRYRMLYFEPALVEPATLSFATPTFTHPAIAQSLHRLYSCLSRPAPRLERETALRRCLDLLSSQTLPPPRPRPEPQAIRLLQDYLEAHYAADISIQTLAQLVNLTPTYLITAFQTSIGIPPHRYLIQVRVRHAQQQLHTAKSLAAIAADTGFYDQSHLHRWFKRIVGITPQQYRTGITPPP